MAVLNHYLQRLLFQWQQGPFGHRQTVTFCGWTRRPQSSDLAVVELPASAVWTDEEELGLPALVWVGDSVRPPAARADAAHPGAFRAAEHADVAARSAICVHALIIARRAAASPGGSGAPSRRTLSTG